MNKDGQNESNDFSFSIPNSSPHSFTKLSGLDGQARYSIFTSQHATVVWPVETCREIFAPSQGWANSSITQIPP
jgi:hypothetical protein